MEGKGDGEVENWVLSDLLLCPEEQTVAEHTHTHIDFLPSVSKEVYKTQSALQMSLIDRGQTPQRNKSHQ